MKKKWLVLLICFFSIILSNTAISSAAFAERPVLVLIATEKNNKDFELFYTEVKRRLFFPNYKVLPKSEIIMPLKTKLPLSTEQLDTISKRTDWEILVFLNIHNYDQHLISPPFNTDEDYVLTNLNIEIYFYDKTNKLIVYKPFKEYSVDYILSADKISDIAREELRKVLSKYLTTLKELKDHGSY